MTPEVVDRAFEQASVPVVVRVLSHRFSPEVVIDVEALLLARPYRSSKFLGDDERRRACTSVGWRLLCELDQIPGVEDVDLSRYRITLEHGELFAAGEIAAAAVLVLRQVLGAALDLQQPTDGDNDDLDDVVDVEAGEGEE